MEKKKKRKVGIAATVLLAVLLILSFFAITMQARADDTGYFTEENSYRIDLTFTKGDKENNPDLELGYAIDSWWLFPIETGAFEAENWNKSEYTKRHGFQLEFKDEWVTEDDSDKVDFGEEYQVVVVIPADVIVGKIEQWVEKELFSRDEMLSTLKLYMNQPLTNYDYTINADGTPVEDGPCWSGQDFINYAMPNRGNYQPWSGSGEFFKYFYDIEVPANLSKCKLDIQFVTNEGEDLEDFFEIDNPYDEYDNEIIYGETLKLDAFTGEKEGYQFSYYYWSDEPNVRYYSTNPADKLVNYKTIKGKDSENEDVLTLYFVFSPKPTPTPTESPTPIPPTEPPKPTETPDTPSPKPTEPPVHVCEFVYDDCNTEGHWYVCKGCGKTTEVHAHKMVATGEADENGNVEKTCECESHPECDYSEITHTCEWIEWMPKADANDDPYEDAEYWEENWKDFGYARNPNIYHWKYCAFHTCPKITGIAKHVPGKLVDAGRGYKEQRCEKCGWLMYQEPTTVSLTIHPNGGTFPDGSKEPRVLHDALRYGSLTELGFLGPEHWVTFEEGYAFTGFYVVTIGLSECVYSPDQMNHTLTAASKYFTPAGNGKYWSKLERNYVLYAQKGAMEYTVHYDGNGGTGTMMDSYYKVGETKALQPNGFQFVSKITYDNGGTPCSIETNLDNTNVHAKFTGWSTVRGGTPVYGDKQVVTDLMKSAGTINLYASWDYGSIVLPNAVSADGGTKLSGWKTQDGTMISVLDATGNFTPVSYELKGGDETFTAVWVPNSYTVSFETYDGTNCAPIYVTYLDTYGNGTNSNDVTVGLPSTTKEGFQFVGWENKLTGDKNVQNSTIVTVAGDHILYAQWIPDDVPITLDYNFDYDGTAGNPDKGNEAVKNEAGENFKEVDANTDTVTIPLNDYYRKYGLPKPTMDGHRFVAWYKEEDSNGNGCGHSECLININDVISNPGPQTIHARWIMDQYRITLDYNYDYTDWEE